MLNKTLIYIFVFLCSTILNGQELAGTWEDNNSNCGKKSGYYFNNDTLIIFNNHFCTSITYELCIYSIEKDTITTTELEAYTIDTNIGFIRTHYKNRLKINKIPLSWFNNSDSIQHKTVEKKQAHKKKEKGKLIISRINIAPNLKYVPTKQNIKWSNIEFTELYKKTKNRIIEKNY